MSTSQKPKKHHFVPVCYLSKFLKRNFFYTLDIRKMQKGFNEYPRKNQPGKICYIEDYYTISEDYNDPQFSFDQYHDLFIESDVLTRLENKYNDIYNKLTSSQFITLSEAKDFSDFIILMKLRNPYEEKIMRDKIPGLLDSSIDDAAEKMKDNPRYIALPDELKRFLVDDIKERNRKDFHYPKKVLLFTLISRHTAENNAKFQKEIVDSSWRILQAPINGPYFITSDNPGFSITSKDELIYNTKFIDDFSFYLPLSPNYCLLITDYDKDNCYSENLDRKNIGRFRASSQFVLFINDKSIQRVNQLLIACDDWYLRKIGEKNKPKSI